MPEQLKQSVKVTILSNPNFKDLPNLVCICSKCKKHPKCRISSLDMFKCPDCNVCHYPDCEQCGLP